MIPAVRAEKGGGGGAAVGVGRTDCPVAINLYRHTLFTSTRGLFGPGNI